MNIIKFFVRDYLFWSYVAVGFLSAYRGQFELSQTLIICATAIYCKDEIVKAIKVTQEKV